jgi:hypothetical protein
MSAVLPSAWEGFASAALLAALVLVAPELLRLLLHALWLLPDWVAKWKGVLGDERAHGPLATRPVDRYDRGPREPATPFPRRPDREAS